MPEIPALEYKRCANYLVNNKRYYRASGTSFSAPVVAAVSSLVMSIAPQLASGEAIEILAKTTFEVSIPSVISSTRVMVS